MLIGIPFPVALMLAALCTGCGSFGDIMQQWKANMLTHGQKYCELIKDQSKPWAVRSENSYYDGERIYYQIADYTGDARWNECAQAAERTYRDEYLLAQSKPGTVAGWMIFPHGLLMDYQRTHDERS